MIKIIFLLIIKFAFAGTISKYKVCEGPLIYKLGSVDEEFGLTTKLAEIFLKQSTEMWNENSKRVLFIPYTPGMGTEPDFTVNFIYDHRQKLTDLWEKVEKKVAEHAGDLKNIKSDAENLNNDYKIELEKFNKANEVLAKRSEEFIKNVNAYKAKINPTKSDYEELASQKLEMENERDDLLMKQRKLQTMARDLNNKSVAYNEIQNDINKEYEPIKAHEGESFKQGITQSIIANGKHIPTVINVYEFSNYVKLKRLLVHELGHALGLAHLEVPKAIMYFQNNGDTCELSPDDIKAMKTLCPNF